MAIPAPAAPAGAAAGLGKQPGLLASLWTSGLWKFKPFVLLYMTGLGVLFPILPTIITNGFASEAAGKPVDCQVFTLEDSPRECRDAHAKAVTMGSLMSFVQGSILSFLFSPIAGHLSDTYGRKPFMTLGIIIQLLPVLTIMMHMWGWFSILWFYPIDCFNGLISSLSMTLTAVADIMRPEHRAASAAFITAMFSIALIIGPIIGGYLQPITAVYTCIGFMGLAFIYLVLVVPEVAPRFRKPVGPHQPPPPPTPPAPPSAASPFWKLSTGWRVLATSNWYARIALIWGLVSVMSNGTANVLAQYLQLQLAFTQVDQAHVMVVSATVSLTTKCTVLGLMIYMLGDQGVMAVGLVAYVAEFLMLGMATTKVAALTAIGVGATGAIVWPATIALQSSRADPKEWGAVAGALQAVGSLTSGIGPLVFAVLFTAFSQEQLEGQPPSTLPYFPQVVWYVAACLAVIAVLLTATLHWGDDYHSKSKAAAEGAAASDTSKATDGKATSQDSAAGKPPAGIAGQRRQRHGAPPTVDAWLLGRAWSMKNSIDSVGTFPSSGDSPSGTKWTAAVGEVDLEQPLLEADDEEAHDEDIAEDAAVETALQPSEAVLTTADVGVQRQVADGGSIVHDLGQEQA